VLSALTSENTSSVAPTDLAAIMQRLDSYAPHSSVHA
jgi:hypothetical protein